MGDTIILTKLDDQAERIIDRFQVETGLRPVEDGHGRRTFEVAGPDHAVDVVQTLTAIDEHWPAHVGLADP